MDGADELAFPLQCYIRIAVGGSTSKASPSTMDVANQDGHIGVKKDEHEEPMSTSGLTVGHGASRALSDTVKLVLVHGFCQNAKVFASRTSNLRSKALKAPGKLKLECFFAESPLVVHDLLKPDDPELDPRGWYNPHEAYDGDASVRPVSSQLYSDWQGPLHTLRSLCHEHGPMHGVLAFSQGGIAAAIQLIEQRSHMLFGIFVSCFAPQDPSVLKLFPDAEHEPINIPTVHVIGTADPFVAEERSLQLARMFKSPLVLYHDGGHIMIPKELFPKVKEFLANVLS